MEDGKKSDKHQMERPPERGTTSLLEYFWSSTCDLHLFYFVIDTVLKGDYVGYIAKRALAGDTSPGYTEPSDLARSSKPGPRIYRLRQSRQELLRCS